AFFRITGKKTVRLLASIACILAAIGFVVGGVAILLSLAWWTPVILGSAVFSSGIFLLFWDKEWHKLVDKGLIGILINMATLVVVLLFQWPDFDF
ncbi:MAG: hypothetical protein SVY53_01230, partial [Chloroflexota bacterium]|nr:hypothetical protein [Chloroflexota bacterium]